MKVRVIDQTADGVRSGEHQVCYATMTLQALARQVVAYEDAAALTELHQRKVFHFKGSGPLCLVEYIDRLRREAHERGNEHADQAYDLTVDKFSRLVGKGVPKRGSQTREPHVLGTRTDCRRYLAAFDRHLKTQ